MRQSSRVEPSNSPSLAVGLHPMLSRALANLDIQLEDELVRYRRQRLGGKRVAPQPGRKQPSHQLDLIAVAATGTPNSVAAQPAPALEERIAGVAKPPVAPDAYKPIPAFTAQAQPLEAPIAVRTGDQPLTYADATDIASGDADDIHALAHANAPQLDDYLESSEELLRSLADEQAEVQAERSFMQSLLTPLGLGSMLLLLLSSAMFGYVIMNPSSLGWLTAQRQPSTGGTQGQTVGTTAVAPPQPNLSNPELPVLDPNNLGTLDPRKSASSSSALPLTASTSQSKPAIATAKPSTEQPSTKEGPTTSTQTSIPAATSSNPYPVTPARTQQADGSSRSAPARASVVSPRSAPKTYSAPVLPSTQRPVASTAARSTANDAYPIKVITHYDSDSALTKSRTVVPDAYLRNFPDGAKIQLGAYGDAAAAEAKAQELRSRGIPAEVYKP